MLEGDIKEEVPRDLGNSQPSNLNGGLYAATFMTK